MINGQFCFFVHHTLVNIKLYHYVQSYNISTFSLIVSYRFNNKIDRCLNNCFCTQIFCFNSLLKSTQLSFFNFLYFVVRNNTIMKNAVSTYLFFYQFEEEIVFTLCWWFSWNFQTETFRCSGCCLISIFWINIIV